MFARLSEPKLLRAETIALCALGGTLVLFHLLGVKLRTFLPLYGERIIQALVLYGVGLLVSSLLMRLDDLRPHATSIRRRPTKHPPLPPPWRRTACKIRRRHHPYRVARDLRLLNAVSLMFVTFIQMKHLTPSLRDGTLDGWFLKLERGLFGGRIPTELTQSILGTGLAPLLSTIYTLFYPFLAVLLLVMIFDHSHRRAEYSIAAFEAMWIVGAGMIWLVPTLGPCFILPETVGDLPRTPVTELQEGLLRGWHAMAGDPRSDRGLFLISGFPSLHCAVPIFGAILYRRRSLLFSSLCAIFAGATAVSTIYFGWHHMLDDLMSIPLAWFSVWTVGDRGRAVWLRGSGSGKSRDIPLS